MTWTTPLKIAQMVLASADLILAAYGAAAFMVHAGYSVTWFCFAWTLTFSVLRVFNRRHDTKNWRVISLGFNTTNVIAWGVATGLLARDSVWIADGKNAKLSNNDPRSNYPYSTWGLAALYCTYAAAAIAGILTISFLATGLEGVKEWNTPLKGLDRKDKNTAEYNPLHQYDFPKHWIAESPDVREV